MTAAPVEVRTVEHGEASEFPELQWQWRRWLTFLATIGALLLLYVCVDRMTTPTIMERLSAIPGAITALKWIALSLIGVVAWCVFIFVAGATGAECVQMVVALKSTRKETTTKATSPASVTTTTAGTTVDTPPDPASPDGTLPPSERLP